MTLPSLYVISEQLRNAASALADLEADEQCVKDTLEGLQGDLEVKATNVIMFARNLESTALAIKEAETAMAARRKRIEARVDSLKAYVLQHMQLTGTSKIEGPLFALSIRKNPPAVEVFNADLVPADYMKQPEPPPPSIDKKLIAAAIKDGFDVPGAKLVQGERLVIG